ncbi:MAG: MBL fold metallo-hydrolase [Gracilibacteraceae bacterium]|jgi:ribonuclease Z|nr:MBL fold metallo-hydrolase [Gracilibacteraceae bacterium]
MLAKTSVRLTMLGTGHAMTTRCYNTCFALAGNADGNYILIDAGGGNQILTRIEAAGLTWPALEAVYLTHAHTDHILGVPWLLRRFAYAPDGARRVIYGHADVLAALHLICRATLGPDFQERVSGAVAYRTVADGDTFRAAGLDLRAFDVQADRMRQFGLEAAWAGGRFVYTGDGRYNAGADSRAVGADWLMGEAFCLERDREFYRPGEKGHGTARDAGLLAARLGAANLVLVHTEDDHLSERRRDYSREAGEVFPGRVHVPDDLETIELS